MSPSSQPGRRCGSGTALNRAEYPHSVPGSRGCDVRWHLRLLWTSAASPLVREVPVSVSPAAPTTLPLGGYADLAAEIRGLGLMRRRPRFYAVLFAGLLLGLGAVVAAVLLLRDSWWALLLAPGLGVLSTQ